MNSTLRRRRLAIGAMIAAAISVSACASEDLRTGSALIINGERITVGDLQDKVAAIEDEREQAGADAIPTDEETRQQIQRMIVHEILLVAGAAHDIMVTETEIDDRLAELEGQFGGAEEFTQQTVLSSIAAEDVRTFIADDIMATKLGEVLVPDASTDEQLAQRQTELNELLVSTANELEVVINPRYGTFDPTTGRVEPPTDPAVGPTS